MPLSLSCQCGARFEVEESFARQTVSCPECQQPVQAPDVNRRPLRTSGYAVAAAVLALTLAFTGIGSVLAVILGIAALVSIRRHRGEVTGAGYAVFGIVWGLAFTGLFAFAVLKGESLGLGGAVREGMMGGQVDRSGPLEVVRPDDGFAITRPSPRWGVARSGFMAKFADQSCDLMLADLSQNAYLDVNRELAVGDLGLFSKQVEDRYRQDDRQRPNGMRPRRRLRLAPAGQLERYEILLDTRVQRTWYTFLIRIVQSRDGGDAYIIRGWTEQSRFDAVQGDFRKAMDSFRLLDP